MRRKGDKSIPVERWLRWQLYKYLKSGLYNYYKNLNLVKLAKAEINPKLIVSLTSFPERIQTTYLSIKSILNQTIKPTKVLLWLGEDQFLDKEDELPLELLNLKKFGLEIFFCEDLKPHTKYYYTFQNYPEYLVVTVDDDIFYPRDMLETLLKHHAIKPGSIIANRVREILIKDEKIKNYRNWPINMINHSNPTHNIIATGVGGVLYEPSLISQRAFDKNKILELAPKADDVWLKAIELVHIIPVVFTNYYRYQFIEVKNSQTKSLYKGNVFEKGNDGQIKRTFEYFQISESLLYSKPD